MSQQQANCKVPFLKGARKGAFFLLLKNKKTHNRLDCEL